MKNIIKIIKQYKLVFFIVIATFIISGVGFASFKIIQNKNETNKILVQFESSGGTKIESQEIKKGERVIKPEDPTKDGFTFVEWILNDEKFDFEKTVTENVILIAKWEANPDTLIFRVNFDSDGGSLIRPIEVAQGKSITPPIQPTKNGYDFDGWYLDKEKFNFNFEIQNDITLIAKWKEVSSYKSESTNIQNSSNETLEDKNDNLEDNLLTDNNKNGNIPSNENLEDKNSVSSSNSLNNSNQSDNYEGDAIQENASISINTKKIRIEKGKSQDIRVSCYPEPKDSLMVGGISNNTSIATCNGYTNDITKFTITGKSVGTTTIDFSYHAGTNQGWIHTYLTVEVYENKVTGISLKNSINVPIGTSTSIIATIYPDNASNKNVIYKSLNENIATVYNHPDGDCIIKGINLGTTKITATTQDGNYYAECTVNVVIVPVESIEITSKNEWSFIARDYYVGDTFQLKYLIKPFNATNKNVKWSSRDPEIASVDNNGFVTILGSGRTYIYVTTEDGGKKDSFTLDCQAKR